MSSSTATSGVDFITTSGLITFEKGQEVATVNITVLGDLNIEDDETIKVKFSGDMTLGQKLGSVFKTPE